MRIVRRLIAGVLFVALLYGGWTFAAENGDTLRIHYVVGAVEGVTVWLALLCAFGAGLASAALYATLRGARLRLESRRYRRAARDLEAEVHQLRSLPLAEDDGGPGPEEALAAAAATERGS